MKSKTIALRKLQKQQRNQQIFALHDKGYSVEAIAVEVGVSASTARTVVKGYEWLKDHARI